LVRRSLGRCREVKLGNALPESVIDLQDLEDLLEKDE
jgi:hypothetical protein